MALDQNTLKKLSQLLTESTPSPSSKIRMEARFTSGAREIQAWYKPEEGGEFKPYSAFIPFSDVSRLVEKLRSSDDMADKKWNVLQMIVYQDGSIETDQLWDEDFEEDVKSYKEPQPED